jgi:uncharacterized protein YecE (DUF72 family)
MEIKNTLQYLLVQQQVFYILPRITPNSFLARLELEAETMVGTIYNTSMTRTTLNDKTEKVGITLPISLVKQTDKGALLFQLPPSFTVGEFKNTEQLLDRLPTANDYDYAMQFRHPSWETEGPWEMLKHYNIAAVMTDSPAKENLQFLSRITITADHSFLRFHGRNSKGHYWYNYLYSQQELQPWVDKVDQIRKQTKILRIYFNNHYGGKAVLNALQFKALSRHSLSEIETNALERAEKYLSNHGLMTSSAVYPP